MKHRYEDELIRLAFGELEGDAVEGARRLLASDPEARRVFESYARLADGLKGLEAPAHQLSTERLRERILRDGLKQRSGVPFWRLAWMPAAAGLVALAITAKLHSGAPAVPLSVDALPSSAIEGPQLDVRVPADPSSGATEAVAPDFSGRRPSILAHGQVHDTGARPSARGARSNEASGALAARGEAAVKVALRLEELEERARSFEAAVLEAAAGDNGDGLVIISLETDADTGARRAVEVPSASNVIVGG